MTAATRSHAPAIAALLLAGLVLYGRVLTYQFVHYDDHELLVDHYGDFVPLAHPARAFTTDAFAVLGPEARGVYFRPLLVHGFGLELRAFGPIPAPFHATNLLLHLFVVVLAYALFAAFGCSVALASALALILLAHPCSALVAAWIPARNESLLAIPCIAALIALLAFVRRGRWIALALCVACYAAAVFTKESGGALLAVLGAAAIGLRSRRAGELRGLLAAGAAAVATSLVFFALRASVLGRSPIGAANILPNLSGLLVYLGKALLPIGLAVVPDPADTPLWPGILAAAGLAALAVAVWRRRSIEGGLGLLWFALFLLPAALVPRQTWGLEYRIYVPLVGLLWCIGVLLRDSRHGRNGTRIAYATACLFAIVTTLRLSDFADAIRYWESAARTAPSSAFAASRVAWRYYEAGRFGEVPDAATRALALDPANADMYLARGIAYARHSDFARAEPDLLRATELAPDKADAWTNLARMQKITGQRERAAESERRAEAIEAAAP